MYPDKGIKFLNIVGNAWQSQCGRKIILLPKHLTELMFYIMCFQYLFILGYYGYDIQEYDDTSGEFIYKSSTYDSRGYYGNFASSVCIDSGVENWCNYSKSGKKTETQDHSKQFPEHFEDDKNLPSDN